VKKKLRKINVHYIAPPPRPGMNWYVLLIFYVGTITLTVVQKYWRKVKKKIFRKTNVHYIVPRPHLVDGILAVGNLLVDAVAQGLVLGRPLRVLLQSIS
jgi:hypothetical protein